MTPFAKYTHYVSVMVQRLAYLAFTREHRGGRGSTPRNGITFIFSRHFSFFQAHPPIIVAVRGSFIPHSIFHEIQGEFSQTVTADNETEKREEICAFHNGQKVQATSRQNQIITRHTSRIVRRTISGPGKGPTAKVLFPHLRSLSHVNKIRRRHLIRGFAPNTTAGVY
jgi:hypothetical protein